LLPTAATTIAAVVHERNDDDDVDGFWMLKVRKEN
jgi:hypothetical protein